MNCLILFFYFWRICWKCWF